VQAVRHQLAAIAPRSQLGVALRREIESLRLYQNISPTIPSSATPPTTDCFYRMFIGSMQSFSHVGLAMDAL